MQQTNHRNRPRARLLSRRRALATVAGGFGAAALAAACGAKKNGAQGSASSAARQTGKPVSGGQINVGQSIDPYTFDPSGEPQTAATVDALVYDGLLDTKRGTGVAFTDVIVQPGLADRWESPDPQTYTFHLHPGAQFADLPPVNGRAVTSADVKWSYEFLSRTGEFQNAKLPRSIDTTYFAGLDRIDTPDAATIVVHFKAPFVPFLNYMAMREWNPIIAHEIFDQDGTFQKRAVGTGPWQLDVAASQQGAHWTLRKNPTYFKKGLPYLDTVQNLVLVDDATQHAAFTSKQIDVLRHTVIQNQTVPQLKRDNPAAVVTQFSSNAGGHLFENTRKPPLDDVRVRRAIALCINRDEFLKAFSGGQGEWAVAGGVPGLFTPAELRQMLPYDPAQARQLLNDAGYPNGVELELMNPGAARGQELVSIDQLIQAQLKRSNINVTLKSFDKATFSARLHAGNYQLDWESKSVEGDPDMLIYLVFYSKSSGNYGGFADPELDKLLLLQRQQLDPAQRKDTLRQAVRRIVDQAWSVAFFYGAAYTFAQPYVKNFAESAVLDTAPVHETWLTR